MAIEHMKGSTQQIKELLQNSVFVTPSKILDVATDKNFTKEHTEYSLTESLVDISNIREMLEKAIDAGIVDEWTYSLRNSLKARLEKVEKYANMILQGNDYVSAYLESIQELKQDVFYNIGLDNRITGLLDVERKKTEYTQLNKKLKAIVSDLEGAKTIHDKLKAYNQEALDQKKQIEETNKHAGSKQIEATNIHTQMSQVLTEVIQKRQDVEVKLSEVKKIYDTAVSHTEEIKSLEERLTTSLTRTKEMEEELTKLLDYAAGKTLSNAFETRKKELEDATKKWSKWTGISTTVLLLAAAGIYLSIVFGDHSPLVSASKVVLLLPIFYAVGFCATNYTRERKLLEEYAFKSSVALTLNPYREILKNETQDSKDVVAFVRTSVENIYSNPLENLARNGQKEKFRLSMRGASLDHEKAE